MGDFASLKIEAASLMDNREDADIDVLMTRAVAMAEDRMNDDLRIREMLVTAPINLTDGRGAFPDDYLAFLVPTDDDWYDLAVDDLGFVVTPFRRAPVNPFAFRYYGKIPPLSVANPTNRVLAAHYQLYLYATCLEAAGTWEAMGGPMTAKWQAYYEQKLNRVRKTDLRARFNTQNRSYRKARP